MVNWLIILILTQTFTDLLMTKRLQTLQSVDVAMERIVQALADTFIFYTSDHGESREERTSLTSHNISQYFLLSGYHLGQFGLL